MSTPASITEYLDSLLFELRDRDPSVARRVLGEAEDHLRESVATRIAAGELPDEAARAALVAFGDPRALARAYPPGATRPEAQPIPLAALARQFTLFAGLVLAAVGVSAVFLFAMGKAGGAGFAVGDATVNVNPTGAPCIFEGLPGFGLEPAGGRETPPVSDQGCVYFDLAAGARDARQDAFVEAVALQAGLGVVGCLCLLALALAPRWGRNAPAGIDIAGPFAAGAVALLAAGTFLFIGRDHDVKSVDGAGWYYSAGLAALLLVAVTVAQVLRSARHGRPHGPVA